ncbi:MAG: glycosidase-like protein [Parcubacteria group bacterium Gr01-1014_106]|nr:MAG: glycosidase-like protein [Parcubacteria group bacterium Gr01-1014_106]
MEETHPQQATRSRRAHTRAALLQRVGKGPLLAPTNRWWEDLAVYNPAAVEGADGVVHILYRAQGKDRVSRLGYATSRDGVTIDHRSPDPVFEPELNGTSEQLGTEDPRLIRMGDTYYMTYTAVSFYRTADPHAEWIPSAPPSWRVRIALASTKDFHTFTRRGVLLPHMDNKDAVLFPEKIRGQYVLLHRLPPDMWIATSNDLASWQDHRVVLRTRPALWDEHKLGAGPPPVRTPEGWLVCYHGVDHHTVYRAGFALLDLEDPSRILGRSSEPALEPQESWEMVGQTPRVVFPSGMVLRGDEVYVYYGGADSVVGVARGSLHAILASLRAI